VKAFGRVAKWMLIAVLLVIFIVAADSLFDYLARDQSSALAFARQGFEEELKKRYLPPTEFNAPQLQNETVWSYTFVWEGSKRNDAS
jgi:hypothetical protein